MTDLEIQQYTERVRQKKSRDIIKYGCLPIGAILLIAILMSIFYDGDKAKEEHLTEQSEPVKTIEQENTELKESLAREIQAIKNQSSNTELGNTIEALQLKLVVYSALNSLIQKADSSANDSIRDSGQELTRLLKEKQYVEYPKLRKRYSEIAAKLLWEDDIYVSCQGKRNDIINYSHGSFAANKNIKEVQSKLSEILSMFRFKQSRYRWYKEADEYTFYDIYNGSDKDLGITSGSLNDYPSEN